MNIADVPLLGMLRERMSWLNARQNTLSQNVANADSPGYLARDLKPLDFQDMLKKMQGEPDKRTVILSLTSKGRRILDALSADHERELDDLAPQLIEKLLMVSTSTKKLGKGRRSHRE